MAAKKLTDQERRLLLYLETRLVDHYGRVNNTHVNGEDYEIAKAWNKTGFIGFGRIASKDVAESGANWVTFSDEAWAAAHCARRARADEDQKHRPYQTTAEKSARQERRNP